MTRLKIELESCYAEDRAEALSIAHNERLAEISQLKDEFCARENLLRTEIDELKMLVANRNGQLDEAKDRSDSQVMQIRLILDRAERDHEREMSTEVSKCEAIVGGYLFIFIVMQTKTFKELFLLSGIIAEEMRSNCEGERQKMEEVFRERLMQVTEEFATELTNNQTELEARHKKKIGMRSSSRHRLFGTFSISFYIFSFLDQQYEKLVADKEESLQNAERVHKRQLTDAETKLRYVNCRPFFYHV